MMSPLDPFLSRRGRRIQWPAKGILQQTAEATGVAVDATIGTALADDGSPMRLESMRLDALAPEELLPYAPAFGLRELREAWRAEMKRKNPSLGNCSLPVVTAGLTHGLHLAGHLFLDEGQELILPDLHWGNYRLLFAHTFGAEPAPFPANNDGFGIAGMRERLLAPGEKKALLLNFPNNPTGYTPSIEEGERIVEAVREAAEQGKRVVVILDDAYFGLGYEPGLLAESLFASLAGCHERVLAVKVDGATKGEYAFGLRIGFLTFGGKGLSAGELQLLEEKTAAAIRATVSSASNPGQRLVLKALRDPRHAEEKGGNRATLMERYRRVKELVRRHGLDALPFNSGFFMCVRLPDGMEAESVRKELLEKGVGVIALPGNLLRIAYSGVPVEKLDALFGAIVEALKQAPDRSH